ncbi:MAG: hypothetical protein SFU98_19640 [Leptospiraceae bacterium]|nr:hypothetical protein [Leptospiraceae bacterium]
MKSITIHNLDDSLENKISEYAEKYNTSLNKAIQALLRKSLNLDNSRELKKTEFQRFLGIWSEKEFQEFEKENQEFSKIDSSDWV